MEETKQVGKGILYGLIAIFSAMLLTSLAVSLLLTATSLEEASFNWLINAISFLSLFIGGFISGERERKRLDDRGIDCLKLFSDYFIVSVFRIRKDIYSRTAAIPSWIFRGMHAGRDFRREHEETGLPHKRAGFPLLQRVDKASHSLSGLRSGTRPS